MSWRRALGIVAGLGVAGGVVALVRLAEPTGPEPTATSEKKTWSRPAEVTVAESIYSGGLGKGWEDWGWGRHELREGQPAGISFEGYGGIVLRHLELSARYGGVVFRFKAPEKWGEFLEVSLLTTGHAGELPGVAVGSRYLAPREDGWREAFVPMHELNPGYVPFDRVMIKARRSVGGELVLLDGIGLTRPGASGGAVREARVRIRCDRPATPIDPLIYGIAHGPLSSGETAHRIGGNPMTRLNWDLGNAWNTGSDWFFENVGSADRGLPDWLDFGVRNKIEMALVVPMIGWVAKDKHSSSFPRSKFPKQQKFDDHRPEAGNGLDPDGKPIAPLPPTQTSVPAPPELIGRWVARLREEDAVRGARGVHLYILDNEPSLWHHTHRDVHPEPVGYDELLDRTVRYGSAVRKADPEAVIGGPAEWGWNGYFYSAKDAEAGTLLRPDRRAHGDVPLVPWYLRQLADHERRTGVRILDVLVLHFYPAAEGIYGSNARTDREGALLRLRSTRSLWDPDYVDESWIKDKIRLIPRMKEWVRENYPGRKVAIGEWSFGAEDHVSGGLAVAEALGRFGREGLDAASYWVGPKEGTAAYWAFRAYRNYDGAGSRFLDFSLPVEVAENLSVFVSRDREHKKMVAILLNLDPDLAVRATLDAGTCGELKERRAFQYGGGTLELKEHVDAEPTSAGRRAVEELPPYSLRVVEWEVSR